MYTADGKRPRVLSSGEQGIQRDFRKYLYNPVQVNIDKPIEIEAEEFQEKLLSRSADQRSASPEVISAPPPRAKREPKERRYIQGLQGTLLNIKKIINNTTVYISLV